MIRVSDQLDKNNYLIKLTFGAPKFVKHYYVIEGVRRVTSTEVQRAKLSRVDFKSLSHAVLFDHLAHSRKLSVR